MTPDHDLKMGETRPRPDRTRYNADQDGAERPGLAANVERQDEGDRRVGGIGLYPNRGVSLLGSPVEDEQAGMKPKGRLAWDEDPVIEASASDQGASADRECLAAVNLAELRLGADRQPTGIESFANREEAVLAALESGSSQMFAAVRSASDWQRNVFAAEEAMFYFSVQEPEFARLRT